MFLLSKEEHVECKTSISTLIKDLVGRRKDLIIIALLKNNKEEVLIFREVEQE